MTNNEKIRQLFKEIGDVEPGTGTLISIKHDEKCPALQSKLLSDCVCEPKFKRVGGEQ